MQHAESAPSSADERFEIAPGVALFATERGLLARTATKWLRVDLHDRSLEGVIITEFGAGPIATLDGAIGRAIATLAAHGLVTRSELRGAASPPQAASAGDERSLGVRILFGAPDDPHLGESVAAAVEAREPFLVAWIDEQGAALTFDDGQAPGCPLCAWFADSALLRYVSPEVAVSGSPRVFANAEALHHVAMKRLAESWSTGAMRPGEVWVYDARHNAERVEPFPGRPDCICAARPHRVRPAHAKDAEWGELARARFAPVWPVEAAFEGRAARVVFRRSRTPWKADASALGVALAAGAQAEIRALAEAIERYCFLHAPPDRRTTSPRALGEAAWDTSQVRSLLFLDQQYAQAGFRFAPYDLDQPLDWCVAANLVDGHSALVPASLVGRVPRGRAALVDATSNGYAAHRDREQAIERALLEVIERDAILLHWYAPLDELPKLEVDFGLPRSCALLATQDVDLPVVLAIAVHEDGSLRCGAAADVELDAALARARAELEVALGGRMRAAGAEPHLERVDRRHEPDDHLRWHAGERGRRTFDFLTRSSISYSPTTLRRRWPGTSSRMSAITNALRACSLEPWIVDRSLPDLFGRTWHVVRAIVPGTVELSWGTAYRRLASPRLRARLAKGAMLSETPHPIA